MLLCSSLRRLTCHGGSFAMLFLWITIITLTTMTTTQAFSSTTSDCRQSMRKMRRHESQTQQRHQQLHRRLSRLEHGDGDGSDSEENARTLPPQPSSSSSSLSSLSLSSRRAFALRSVASIVAAAIATASMTTAPDVTRAAELSTTPSTPSSSASELTVYKTPSGLKYIDLVPGTGPTPKYGQLISITYAGYIKLPSSSKNPNPQPVLFEQDAAGYLMKHGNGRVIAGLEEGLHTMQVGGKRRLLIPPKLGYVDSGLGPIPDLPWERQRLNDLLEQMVQQVGGTLIFEVQLLSAMDDEADQGYYQDDALSPADFDTLRTNLQRKVQTNLAAAQAEREAAAAAAAAGSGI